MSKITDHKPCLPECREIAPGVVQHDAQCWPAPAWEPCDCDNYRALRSEVEELKAAIKNGVQDGTLDCVVRGKAPECPELGIRRPEQMCGACRIRVTAEWNGARRRSDDRSHHHPGERGAGRTRV